MGKKSIKENKNVYQVAREDLGLTRAQASDLLEFMSSDRIEKIESEKSLPQPDEVLQMAKCYKRPEMCNYYCTHECAIGKETVDEVDPKDLSQITLEILNSLNELDAKKERFISITVDGKISSDEEQDFLAIQEQLRQIQVSVDALNLWIEKTINEGTTNKEAYLRSKK